jgi:carbohydrate diacid regulator
MELQISDAREIVTELSKLLGTRLNIMNSRGFIIASSDESRIGTFHAGAYEIIESNLDELEIHDGETWEGAVSGQNFPLRLNGKIIGVVGITGAAEETARYGSIIRKMTEILVMGKAREEALFKEQTERVLFLTNWLNGSDNDISDAVITRGKSLGIDITSPHRIAVAFFEKNPRQPETETERVITTAAVQQFPGCTCFVNAGNLIVILENTSEHAVSRQSAQFIAKIAGAGISVYIGISPSADDYLHIHEAYTAAQKALAAARRKKSTEAVFYQNLGIELISDVIPLKVKEEFTDKVFAAIQNEKKADVIRLLTTFYRNNGSLKITAAELGTHPNTIEYRLNRLSEQTGYDPRTYEGSCMYQIAINFVS